MRYRNLGSSHRIMVTREAWTTLEAAINLFPKPEPNLFVTGGPLEDVDPETEFDWALYHAAFLLKKVVDTATDLG